jgi:hypothetical protein
VANLRLANLRSYYLFQCIRSPINSCSNFVDRPALVSVKLEHERLVVLADRLKNCGIHFVPNQCPEREMSALDKFNASGSESESKAQFSSSHIRIICGSKTVHIFLVTAGKFGELRRFSLFKTIHHNIVFFAIENKTGIAHI